MHRRRPTAPGTLLLALLVLLLSAGCSRIIVDNWPEVRIRGTVVDHTGSPLGSASIRAEVREIGCASAIWTIFDARTDARGRFEVALEDARGTFRGCLTIEIAPAPASALPVTTLVVDSLHATPRGHGSDLELTLMLPAP